MILKPEVSDRTSYGRGEALQSAHRPVSMNSSDADDIADALFNADGISSNKQNTDAMLHLLGAGMDKNFSSVGASRDENGKMSPVGMIDSGARAHEPFEAQILGGFKKNEVEGIHYPYSKVSKIAESEDISDVVSQNTMKSKLEKLGFTPEEIAYFYSMSGGKPINTASMTKLKEFDIFRTRVGNDALDVPRTHRCVIKRTRSGSGIQRHFGIARNQQVCPE